MFGRVRVAGLAGCLLGGAITLLAQTQPPAPQDQAPHSWRKAEPGDAATPAAGTEQGPSSPAATVNASDAAPDPTQAQAPDAAPPQAWPDPQAQPQNPSPAAAPQNPAPQGGNVPPPQYGAEQSPYNPAPDNSAPYNPAPYNGAPYNPGAAYGNYAIPATLTIAPGTYVTVRVNGWLSSDRNQPGDAFTATLAEPLIVNGVVVAQRGQTVGGVVTEAKKAGRVEGTSRLGVKLTDITLADGQKVNLQTSMTMRAGNTSVGRDAAAIGGTTALGAAVGATADWGRGAAIGAGAGAAAGILGVLLTRGHPTVVTPESMLTFRVDAPTTIDTTHAPQAFHYADQGDYGQQGYPQGPPPARMAGPCYGCGAPAPAPYYGPAYYPYYSPYPYYWGPGFSFYLGRPYYYPRFYAGGLWFRRR